MPSARLPRPGGGGGLAGWETAHWPARFGQHPTKDTAHECETTKGLASTSTTSGASPQVSVTAAVSVVTARDWCPPPPGNWTASAGSPAGGDLSRKIHESIQIWSLANRQCTLPLPTLADHPTMRTSPHDRNGILYDQGLELYANILTKSSRQFTGSSLDVQPHTAGCYTLPCTHRRTRHFSVRQSSITWG